MSYHMDEKVNKKIVELLDELCEWERGTGRKYTLLLIPHNPEESLLIALDGKPVQKVNTAKATDFFMMAFTERKNKLMGF
jgi:hypothetical protein